MKKSLVFLLVVFVVAGSVLAGCSDKEDVVSPTASTGAATSTSSGGSEPPATVTTTSASTALSTNPFVERDYLDSQAVDLASVANLDAVALSDAQKQALARQSFVAVVQDPMNGPWKFWHVYENARYEGLPVLVTTDSLLNAYHGLFDTLLQRLEEGAIYDQAVAMTQALLGDATDQWNAATDPVIKEEARLNVAYFAVAAGLLAETGGGPSGAGSEVAAGVETEVGAELALIDSAAGPDESPILHYAEDYSQYKPRGHYTRSEKLERYFKAMMWYGHTGFFINPRDPDVTLDEALSLTRRAILVSSSLIGPARAAWMAIYEPTSFMVGRADDITIDDMEAILSDVFGTTQPSPDDLADENKIDAVRSSMNELPAPKILSATIRAPGDTETREENERSFRVMGQRYIPDSYALQQLVWAYVGEESPPESKRDLPMGLDVMTVLGSDQAFKIAKEDFGQDRYKNWESQLKKVHDEFATGADDLWPSNLYTGWLESLQHVMAFPGEGAPDFMKSQAWARKSLNTALGSWTELRHDTILYAKQSVVAEGDGGEEPETAGYVEPYPAFYAKIAELATTMRRAMDQYGLTDSEAANKLDIMVELAQSLATIAHKELSGEQLTSEELGVIKWYGSTLEGLEQFDTYDQGITLSPTAEKSPLVADVHSSYNSGLALEEATGYPLILYAAFELDGKLQIFCGASYAYYEFTAPLDGRLTDEEWTALLDSGAAPPRPAWTNEWIVGE